jgi:tRNA (guanine26-N2/guanine27-N2)-dimethyltransferase
MAGDRDIAVAFARAHFARSPPPGASGWEVAAATGVRGLRLLHESRVFRSFVLTESHPDAFRVLGVNAARYPGALAVRGDGRQAPTGTSFDYVDIDPFGTPVPFVPAGLAAVRDGGILAVTATDMMVLAGVQPGACERRYGARPIRGRLGPESGLRILVAHVDRMAREGGRSARPLLAYVRDHHVRAYLSIERAPVGARSPVGVVDPGTFDGPPVGERGPYGPLWLGPLFDPQLTGSLEVPPEPARAREVGVFLERVRDEAEVDRPFFYEPNLLARDLGIPRPPSLGTLLDALRRAGYAASRTHARPEGFRTTAPRSDVEALVRAAAA